MIMDENLETFTSWMSEMRFELSLLFSMHIGDLFENLALALLADSPNKHKFPDHWFSLLSSLICIKLSLQFQSHVLHHPQHQHKCSHFHLHPEV